LLALALGNVNDQLHVPTTLDVAISGDRNVVKKESKKILKYKDLTIEIQHM
jgi:hypothetical protein